MGGKTAQSSSQVTIPPEVLARYNSVNATAEQAAQNPFQIYSTDPSAFVAPVNAEQQAGISSVNDNANLWQPYFGAATNAITGAQYQGGLGTTQAYNPLAQGQNVANNLQGTATGLTTSALNQASPYNTAATGLALAGTQAVDPSALNVNQYLNPYLNTVLAGTLNPMIQQQQQQQSALTGNQIANGAFGGDRAGIDAAVLAQQQNLALGQAASSILQPAYETALSTAQQQQGVGLGAAQANRAAIAGAAPELAAIGQQAFGQTSGTGAQLAGLGQQYFGQGATTSQQQAALAQQLYGMGANTAQIEAGLGTGAQTAGLTGAQAQIGAGTLEQQTQQAGLTALYNQFQQQQGYPFQVAQFLANIAEGTGALSGSTTTSTQPVMGFFSDERLKEDIEPIGKTFDGQNIIKFRYKGEKAHRIGLSAQETEKKHPDAVGLAGGYRYVDYDKATDDAAKRGHFHSGGGTVEPEHAYEAYAAGGGPGFDLGSILQAQQNMYGTFRPGGGGLGGYGSSIPNTPSTAKLAAPSAPTIKQQNPVDSLKDMNTAIDAGSKLYKTGQNWMNPATSPTSAAPTSTGLAPPANDTPDADMLSGVNSADTSGAGLDAEGNALSSFDDFSGFADGGQVDDGTYPLSNTYANYLAQQKAHPFTGSGLYGNPLITAGVGGPYTTMLEGPNPALHILQVEAPRPTPYKPHDPSDASSEELARANKKAGLTISPEWRGGRLGRDDGGYVPDNDNQQHPALAVSQPPPPPKDNTMQDIGQAAQIAAAVASMMRRGGRIHKLGGGIIASDPTMSMPYGGSGYVPEQERTAISLNPPGTPSGQQGGSSGIGQLGQLAQMGLGIASLFKRGGRAGYDDGGTVDEPTDFSDSMLGRGLAAFQDKLGAGRAPNMADASRYSDQVAGEPSVVPSEPGDHERVSNTYEPVTARRDNVVPIRRTVSPRAGLVPPNPAGPSQPPQPLSPLTNTDVAPIPAAKPDNTTVGAGPAAPQTSPTASPDTGGGIGSSISRTASGLGQDLSDAYHSLGLGGGRGVPEGATPTSGDDSDFMSRNQSWLVPLLKGVGAATLYPGKSLFGALTYGAMEGGESYEDIQNQLAERKLTGAESAVQQQQVRNLTADEIAKYAGLYPGGYPVNVNGQTRFIPLTALRGSMDAMGRFVPDAQASIGANGMGQMNYLGNVGQHVADSDAQSFMYNTKVNSGMILDSNATINRVNNEGSMAASNNPRMLMTASSLAANTSGALQPGAVQPVLRDAAATWNSLIDRFVQDPAQRAKYEFASNQELTQAQIAEKMSVQNVSQLVQQTGQHAFAAMGDLMHGIPNTGMTRDTALDLSALMIMENQRAIDKQQYFSEYGQRARAAGAPTATSYMGQNAERAFNADFSPQKYAREQQQLRQVLSSPSLMSALQSQDPKSQSKAYDFIDSQFGRGFHRYFTGYQ